MAILDTLLGPEFLANETSGWEGILKHGIYHEGKKLGVDESVMWGEYFFLSALDKALGGGAGNAQGVASDSPPVIPPIPTNL